MFGICITEKFLFLFLALAISSSITEKAFAQGILPLALERVIESQPVVESSVENIRPRPVIGLEQDHCHCCRIALDDAKELSEMSAPSGEAAIVNIDWALVEELRRNRRFFERIGTDSQSGIQDKQKIESAAPEPATQNPIFNPLDDERWRKKQRFNWDGAMKQSAIFLGIQHAFRLATEEGTRADLKGPFFKDYLKALKSLRGWDDGDPFIVNYIGHPMMGSVAGFIQVHNDPRGINEEVSLKKSYWVSRLKATAWSFAYSTQFELGLISEASLGNIGIRPYGNRKHPMAYVDIVITPVVGTGWLVGEDLLDKHFIRRFEDRMPDNVTFALFRSFLNPTRSFANILRGKKPWHRDNRP